MIPIFLLFFVPGCISLNDPVVFTEKLGYIEGLRYRTKSGFDTDVFLGIPYAQPPVGPLRFEKPLPFANPSESSIRAKQFGHPCYPSFNITEHFGSKSLLSFFPTNFSEDCLTINIVTPSNKRDEGYPVLVYIHGGGFELGSSIEYGYMHMSEHLVSREIIFVSFHYRLGFLGFLSTGDRRLPGNLGLWDQTMALQFIHDNIAAFGGDPQRITVMGSSAGSMSVSALTISPHSNGLFNQMIALSGSILTRAALSNRVVDMSQKLISNAGCASEDSGVVVACLKGKTVEELYNATFLEAPFPSTYFIRFHPRVEDDFFPGWYYEALGNSPPKTTLIGAAEKECLMFFLMAAEMKDIWAAPIDTSKLETFSEGDFLENLEKTASEYDYGHKAEELRKLLKEFYLRSEQEEVKNNIFYLDRFVEIYSDTMFNIPLYVEAETKMRNGWEMYLYQQEYANMSLQTFPVKGVMHGNDILYLFDLQLGINNSAFNEDDYKYRAVWFDLLENFIKTGNPSTQQFRWNPITRDSPSQYLSLTTQPEMKPHYRQESVNFWTEVVPKEILSEILSFKVEKHPQYNIRSEL